MLRSNSKSLLGHVVSREDEKERLQKRKVLSLE